MEFSGRRVIPVSRQRTWEGLNDPELLRRALAGCQEMVRVSDDEFHARVELKLGPVLAKLAGKVRLSDIDAPNSYAISGEGTGAAGFARGGATVVLSDEEGGTVLAYEARAMIGGKLAQIGARLFDGAARKIADDFFMRFAVLLTEEDAGEEAS